EPNQRRLQIPIQPHHCDFIARPSSSQHLGELSTNHKVGPFRDFIVPSSTYHEVEMSHRPAASNPNRMPALTSYCEHRTADMRSASDRSRRGAPALDRLRDRRQPTE